MKFMLKFSRDEIQKEIPYMVICEAHEGARWNTGRRKRLWNEWFTEQEKEASTRIFRLARSWALVKGAPKTLTLTPATLALWRKLGDFCASL